METLSSRSRLHIRVKNILAFALFLALSGAAFSTYSGAQTATKPAAEETPRISPLTRGFLNMPWKDAPLIDNAAPIIIAMIARGRRICIITASIAEDQS